MKKAQLPPPHHGNCRRLAGGGAMSGQRRDVRDQRDERDNSIDSHIGPTWRREARRVTNRELSHRCPPPPTTSTFFTTLFHLSLLLFTFATATAADRYWVGATSASASNAANWSSTAETVTATDCPADGDIIYVGALAENRPMTWDLANVTPGGWTQTADYTGTNTFNVGTSRAEAGTLAADGVNREFKVNGNVVLNGGVWTCGENCSFKASSVEVTSMEGKYRLFINVTGDMTVGADAALDVSGCGFERKVGTGYYSTGGSHGSLGQLSGYNDFGNPFEPDEVCPGGNSDYLGPYGAGAVKVTVGGTLTLDGLVDATPQKYYKYNLSRPCQHYSAPGGSIWLTAAAFAGSGTVKADHGYAQSSGNKSGGGRIALYLTDAASTFEDLGWTVSCLGVYCSGTLYRELATDQKHHGELVLKGWNADAARSCGAGNYNSTNYFYSVPLRAIGDETEFRFRKITMSNGAILNLMPGTTLDLTGTELSVNSTKQDAIALSGATLKLPGNSYTFDSTKPRLFVGGPHSQVVFTDKSVPGSLTIANTAILDYPLSIAGSVTVANGGVIKHSAEINTACVDFAVDLTVSGDFTVQSGGKVNVDSCGFTGQPTGTAPGHPVISGGGGSYGGRGAGAGSDSATYGDPCDPQWCGSGSAGIRAGGLVKLEVSGAISLAGPVSASSINQYGGNGSGGGINIKCGTITSTSAGTIIADSAANNSWGSAGGGGGRIAIAVRGTGADFSNLAGVVHAWGGGYNNPTAATKKHGGAGTVYYRLPGEGLREGTVVIENGNHAYQEAQDATTEFGAAHDGMTFRTIKLKNKGQVRVRKGVTINVTDRWENEDGTGVVDSEAGDADNDPGCVAFTDATRTGYIVGTNSFAMLKCTTPGKILRFGGEGSLLGIDENGLIKIEGYAPEEGDPTPVILKGLTDEASWLINIGYNANSSLKVLEVYNSDASLSVTTPVAYDTPDNQTCQGWNFVNVVVGEENEWTGGESNNWGDGNNWSLGRKPETTDVVKIPGTAVHWPTLNQNVELQKLEIASGARLTLGGYSLTVLGEATIAGELQATASESVFFYGDTDFTGGSFVRAASTVTLAGDDDVAFKPGGNGFYLLNLAKTGGTVSWTGAASAHEVIAAGLTAPFAVAFAAGAGLTADILNLDGTLDAAAALTLGGSGAWTLNATKLQRVKGVIAGNSQATGLKIWALSPCTDNGGNSNWAFNADELAWTGAVNSYFDEPLNWAGGAAPGVEDCVRLTGAEDIVLTNSATVREVVFASGRARISATGEVTLTVGGALSVESGATAVLDAPASAGNVILRSGALLQHTPSTTPSATIRRLELRVTGDMLIEEGALIDALARGYQAGYGPGCCDGAGSMHGGRGARAETLPTGTIGLCYGSVFDPVEPGSGGNTSFIGTCSDSTVGGHGGGMVRLTVGGTLEVNGAINADGWSNGTYYVASGGAIRLDVGRLAGTGSISADGGLYYSGGLAGGGRIAIYRTAEAEADTSAFTGEIHAWGSRLHAEGTKPVGGCGSVYYEWSDTPAKGGLLVYDNGNTDAYRTDLYAAAELGISAERGGDAAGDFKNVRFKITNRGAIQLLDDFTIGDLDVATANGYVHLNDHVLTMMDRTHFKGRGWKVSYPTFSSAAAVKGPNGVGRFVWYRRGMMIILR